MVRSRILPAALAATMALGAAGGAALAQGNRQQQQQQRGQHGGREDDAEIAAVLGARIAPADAVASAERAANGRAVKLSMDDEDGAGQYEVRVATADRMVTVKIDPATGAVQATERDGVLARLLDREDRDELQALLKTPTTLGQAIAAAERAAGGGRAVEAEWEGEGQALVYEVEIAKDGGGTATKVVVDATSGQARLSGSGAPGGGGDAR